MTTLGKATQAIHGREDQRYHSAVYPIYQTSTFGVEKTDDYKRFFVDGEPDVYVYTRVHNPTIRNVEERLAVLELAEDAVLFSSGMAAVSATLLSLVSAGDTLVAARPLYGGTYHLLTEVLPRFGVQTVFLEGHELYQLDRLVPHAKAVYFETPTNPTCACISLDDVVAVAKRLGAITVVDNTFASPINQNPLAFGIDIVLHSATKYIGGHSDVIAGAVMTSRAYIEGIRELLMMFGGCASPLEAFLLDRSLKTLPLRIKQHNESAMTVAQFFAAEPRVKAVHYPGLPDSPDHEVAKRQMRGFGGMLAIDLGSEEAGKAFCDALNIGLNAVSLGGVETLITMPALSTHAKVSAEELRIARVTPGTVRISVGLEDVPDLIADFEQALNHIPVSVVAMSAD